MSKVIAARFLGAAATPGGGPPPGPPEVAIAGRSNVGKSALINALVGRRGLARASRTPGRTRQLNFFALDERIVLVDLPGYGFAVGPEAERDRKSTRLNSSHQIISYAVFCLKKK